MTDEKPKTHLKRGEAPRLLRDLHGRLQHDFAHRSSGPEIAAVTHSAMTVAEVRARYGLPDALPDSKIEAEIAKVTYGRAEAGPSHVVCIRMRDGKLMHVETVVYPQFAESLDKHGKRIDDTVDAARRALQAQIGKRRRGLERHAGRRGADYIAIGISGWEPEIGRGDVLRGRGKLYQAWKAAPVSEEEAAALVTASALAEERPRRTLQESAEYLWPEMAREREQKS